MILEILWVALFVAATIQFVYLFVIFGRLAFFQPIAAALDAEDMKEGVSVVVASHNELKNLKKLLPALASQQYPKFEILVINDRSTDGTPSFLREMLDTYPQLRTVTIKYIPPHVTGKKYALTLGIKVAKYDIILLTDADCLPATPQWVALMTQPLRKHPHTQLVLGYGAYQHRPGLLNTLIQFETLVTALQYFSFALYKAPFMGVGRNMVYRKSFFLEKKAFKGVWHINGGDDDLFVNKHSTGKNTAVVIHPQSITVSKPKTDWKSFVTQKTRHYHVGKYYNPSSKLKLGMYAASQLVFWIVVVLLLFLPPQREPIAIITGLLVSRALAQTYILKAAKNKLEGDAKVNWMMFFDLPYLGYFWVVGMKGYLSKKIKWR